MNYKEKVIVVVIDYALTNGWSLKDVGFEMEELVRACQAEVLETVSCRIDRPTASYFIGTGKVDEIAEMTRRLKADTVVFSRDLKGSQQRNLEEAPLRGNFNLHICSRAHPYKRWALSFLLYEDLHKMGKTWARFFLAPAMLRVLLTLFLWPRHQQLRQQKHCRHQQLRLHPPDAS